MPQRHFEDFSPGSVSQYGPRLVTRDEIVEFAAAFDPQPMHLDEAAAQASMLGTLSGSGLHRRCLLRRLLTGGLAGQASFPGAAGGEEVRLPKPLRAGETRTGRAAVLETRASSSPPDMGFVKFLFELF